MNHLKHVRRFGIEIEIGNLSTEAAQTALQNAGFSVYDPYCGYVRNQDGTPSSFPYSETWKVVRDGSVADGSEVVSPILSGDEGLAAVRKVVKALKTAGAKVDKRCGFHVHVDAQDLEVPEIFHAVIRYDRYESQIDSFVSSRRRKDESRWCQSMNSVARNIGRDWYRAERENVHNFPSNRYKKLNVAAFIRHGTLEFRQHEGTLNISKMIHWIIFAVNFVENSRLNVEYKSDYKVKAEYYKLFCLASYLSNPNYENAYDRQIWRIAAMIGVDDSKVSQALENLTAAHPVFKECRIVGGYIMGLPKRVQLDRPQTELTFPDSPGLLEGLSPQTVKFFTKRLTQYSQTAQV